MIVDVRNCKFKVSTRSSYQRIIKVSTARKATTVTATDLVSKLKVIISSRFEEYKSSPRCRQLRSTSSCTNGGRVQATFATKRCATIGSEIVLRVTGGYTLFLARDYRRRMEMEIEIDTDVKAEDVLLHNSRHVFCVK